MSLGIIWLRKMVLLENSFLLTSYSSHISNRNSFPICYSLIYSLSLFLCTFLITHSNTYRCNLSNQTTQRTNSCFIRLLWASTCFEHNSAHHQVVKIVLYSIWYHHTCSWSPNLRTGRPPTCVMIPDAI